MDSCGTVGCPELYWRHVMSSVTKPSFMIVYATAIVQTHLATIHWILVLPSPFNNSVIIWIIALFPKRTGV